MAKQKTAELEEDPITTDARRMWYATKQENDEMAEKKETSEEKMARLESENAALKDATASKISMKVGAKGGLSVGGLQRFPITLYREQWETLLGMGDDILAFIRANDKQLKRKGDRQ